MLFRREPTVIRLTPEDVIEYDETNNSAPKQQQDSTFFRNKEQEDSIVKDGQKERDTRVGVRLGFGGA